MLTEEGCPKNMRAIKDALEIVEGRWKLPILIAIATAESKRFGEITKEIGISDRMLAKELKTLEMNKLVERHASELSPTVTYSITAHGKSLQKLMTELYQWGLKHRQEIIGQ